MQNPILSAQYQVPSSLPPPKRGKRTEEEEGKEEDEEEESRASSYVPARLMISLIPQHPFPLQ